MKVKCLCIDDSNKPSIIPNNLWVKKGRVYTINWVYKMVNQNSIQGCDLDELDISKYHPYNCFKLNRFAINVEDLLKLKELISNCTELSDVDISLLVEELDTVELN